MRKVRFQLKTLMILILAAALGFGLMAQLLRMQPIDFHEIRERLLLLGMFLVVVTMKLVLIMATRGKRGPGEPASEALIRSRTSD